MRRSFRSLLTVMAGMVATVAVMAPAALADGPKVEQVKLLDQCEPASFNAAFGAGFCQRTGSGVSFAEFSAKLNPTDFGHNAWWINASGGRLGNTKISYGDKLHVTNEGGIAHTFTEVAQFGGGCIPPFTLPLGLPLRDFASECLPAFATSFVPQGTSIDVDASILTPGVHRFQCFFHPWMRQTVTVEVKD
jgi:plastocyanin